MTEDSRRLLDLYLPRRRRFEIGFWVATATLNAVINSRLSWLEIDRVGLPFQPWEPVCWEVTSALVSLALVPAVIAFERRFPLQFQNWRRALVAHALATIPYCLLHVGGMVALRKAVYALKGSFYDFGDWPRELGYEFLKDWKSYVGVLALVYFYRLLLLRLQGEATLLDAPDEGPAVEPIERPDRFLVRKLGKEFLLAANDIEFLQASGNYINLRVRGRDYPLRATMASLEPRMDPARFLRVHRSYMINLDCLSEIEPLETGDARLLMSDGTRIPCSRRYRSALKR